MTRRDAFIARLATKVIQKKKEPLAVCDIETIDDIVDPVTNELTFCVSTVPEPSGSGKGKSSGKGSAKGYNAVCGDFRILPVGDTCDPGEITVVLPQDAAFSAPTTSPTTAPTTSPSAAPSAGPTATPPATFVTRSGDFDACDPGCSATAQCPVDYIAISIETRTRRRLADGSFQFETAMSRLDPLNFQFNLLASYLNPFDDPTRAQANANVQYNRMYDRTTFGPLELGIQTLCFYNP